MDHAEERFGKTFVSDIKAVLSVCVIFLTYPFFWALYDQQGSRSLKKKRNLELDIRSFWSRFG